MTLTQAILATLRYCDHFDYPLTLEEIHLRLIQTKATKAVVAAKLAQLVQEGKISQTGIYFSLPSRSSLAARRLQRAKSSEPQLKRARAIAAKLARIPGILALYVTGSLAMHNSDSNADIDLMVVTYDGRLWTTRLLLTLYTEILGLRRHPHASQATDKLCLNLYLSPASFNLPQSKRSLYTAYELIQAVPLYDPASTRNQLLADNSWITDLLPNIRIPKSRSTSKTRANRHTFIESMCYRLQLAYMHRKITREYITRNAAFFHPRDPGATVLRKIALVK